MIKISEKDYYKKHKDFRGVWSSDDIHGTNFNGRKTMLTMVDGVTTLLIEGESFIITDTDYEEQVKQELERINAIDFKAFTLGQLNSVSQDLNVRLNTVEKLGKGDRFTICEHGSFSVDKGSENLYLTIDIYLKDSDSEKAYTLEVWIKERHEVLKAIVKRILNQL